MVLDPKCETDLSEPLFHVGLNEDYVGPRAFGEYHVLVRNFE